MIKRKELDYLYNWAKETEFKLLKEPTSSGHPTNPILYCPLKWNMKTLTIRKRIVKDEGVLNILSNEDILFCGYVSFQPNTEHGPHKDLDVYVEKYKRIQIPVKVPNQTDCYMIWQNDRVVWEEGIPHLYEVMDYVHEGYNYSNQSLEFLFLDVKRDCFVELL